MEYHELTTTIDRMELQETNDCAVLSVATITGLPYKEIHSRFQANGRRDQSGTKQTITWAVLQELGWEVGPADDSYAGVTVNNLALAKDEAFLVTTAGHIFAYQNGVQDWTRGRRHQVIAIYKVTKVRSAENFATPLIGFDLDSCVLCEESKRFLRPVPVSSRDHISIDMDDDGERFDVRLYEVRASGDEGWPSERAKQWGRKTPGMKEHLSPGSAKGYYYLLPAGMYSVLRMITTFGLDKISFTSTEAQLKFEVVRARFFQGEHIARVNYEWQQFKIVPPHKMELHPDMPLSKYQQVAAYLCTISESFALFMEQGTGKTATIIAALCNLAKVNPWTNHLVIAPRSVVYNWRSEIRAFATQQFKIGILRGLEYKRIEALADAIAPDEDHVGSICITNYESAVAMGPVLKRVPWATLVLDESHSIASPRTKRTKFFLRTMRQAAKQRFILTGTPIANTAMDLWSQFEFMSEAGSGFSDFKSFNKFFGKFQKTAESGFEQLVGIQHAPLLKENMARSAFVIRKKEALPDLPEKLYSTLEVEMSPAQAHCYREVATKLAVEIENELETSSLTRAILIQNVLVKLLRLAQITSGHIVWDPVVTEEGVVVQPRKVEHFTDTPRLDALVEILKKDAGPDEKTIIWSCWVPALDAIEARLTAEGIKYVRYEGSDDKRKAQENQFNTDDATTVFLGNPASAGVGLNLLGYDPKAEQPSDMDATRSVYFSMNWSAVKRSQSSDRNHRRGTRRPVTEITLLVPNSIDVEIYERVIEKQEMALEISDIRAILSSILQTKDQTNV